MTATQKSIYIENFRLDISSYVIKNVFSTFGEVIHVEIPTFPPGHLLNASSRNLVSKGFAFIEFKRPEDARKACEFFRDFKSLLEILNSSGKNTISRQSANKIHEVMRDADHESILSCTVIPKNLYNELNNQYRQERFKSLTRAAKMLVIS